MAAPDRERLLDIDTFRLENTSSFATLIRHVFAFVTPPPLSPATFCLHYACVQAGAGLVGRGAYAARCGRHVAASP